MTDQTYVSEILVEVKNVAQGLRDIDAVQRSLDEAARSGRIGEEALASLTKQLTRAGNEAKRSGGAYSGLSREFKDLAAELNKAEGAWKRFNQQSGTARPSAGPASSLDPSKATTADLRAQQQAYEAIGRTREESVRRELASRDRVAERARAQTQEQLRQNSALADSERALQAARDQSADNARLAGLSKEERAKEELARANKRLADSETEVFRTLANGDRRAQARAVDEVTRAVREQDRAQAALNATTRQAQGAIGDYDQRLTTLRYALFDVGQTLAGVSAGLIGGGGLILSTFAQFESGLATVSRTTGYTGAALDGLADQLQNLATRVPVSVQGLTDIATAAGQMGIAGDDLLEFTEVIAQFSTISDSLNAEDAAATLARIAQLTGTTNFRGVASAVAALSDELNATDQQIVQTAREVARAGAIAGLSADEVIGLSGALASLGVQPEGARSVLFQFFTQIDESIRGANDNLDDFAALMGITEQEVANLYRNDPAAFLLRFNEALSTVDPDNLSGALDALGIEGARAAPVFAVLAQNIREFGVEGSALGTAFATSSTAFNDMSLLAEKLAPFLATLSSQFQLLLNDLVNLAITVGEAAAPVMQEFIGIVRQVLEDLNAFAQTDTGQSFIELAAKIGTTVAVITAVAAPLALAAGGTLAVATAVQIVTARIAPLIVGFRNLYGLALGTATNMGLTGVRARAAAGGLTLAAGAARVLTLAVKALGAALLIGFIVDFEGSMRSLVNLLVGAQQVIIDGFYQIAAGINAAVGWVGSAIPAFGALRDIAVQAAQGLDFLYRVLTGINQLSGQQTLQNFGIFPQKINAATSAAQELADIPLPTYMDDLGDASLGAADGVGDLGGAADGASGSVDELAEKVRTLVDYASDLQGVFSRAFELRFSSQGTYDAVTSSFLDLTERFDDAARSIRDLRQEINELNADMQGIEASLNTQRYFLSIAVEYGDDLRATEIRARISELESELAGKRNDLADKSKDLANAEQENSKGLTGNSKAAIKNRKALTDLVSQYQDHLVALASSGKSQEEVATEASKLKNEFLAQARALGYADEELAPYAAAFDDLGTIIRSVPRDITVEFNANPALQALAEFQAKIEEVNDSMAGLGSGLGSGGVGGGGGGGFDWGNLFGDDSDLRTLKDRSDLLRSVRREAQKIGKTPLRPRNRPRSAQPSAAQILENYDFGEAIEANLDLGSVFSRQGPKINQAMRSNGLRSKNEYVSAFESGLDLTGPLSRAGDKAAPALRTAGTKAGGFFREGFSSTSNISDLLNSSASSTSEPFRDTGKRAGHTFRSGFNDTSYTYDLVANSARSAGTSDFYNTGANAGRSFREGFKTTGSLDIAVEVPGVKVANNGAGKMRFFSDGGFTGRGGKYDPAGIVHRGEYVVPKHLVNQATGLPYADAMGRLPRGSQASGSYSGGGYVRGGSGREIVDLGAGSLHTLSRLLDRVIELDGQSISRNVDRRNTQATNNGAR